MSLNKVRLPLLNFGHLYYRTCLLLNLDHVQLSLHFEYVSPKFGVNSLFVDYEACVLAKNYELIKEENSCLSLIINIVLAKSVVIFSNSFLLELT